MPLFGTLNDKISWTDDRPEREVLEHVLRELNISAILFSGTAEPFSSILDCLAFNACGGSIVPDDTETRTFLHEIPVATGFSPEEIIPHLKRRKGVIVPGKGIITTGMITPEQAFVTFSSICFSCYVRLLTDYYYYTRGRRDLPRNPEKVIRLCIEHYGHLLGSLPGPPELKGPFSSERGAMEAIIEAGRLTVESSMVDSYFGNISALYDGSIYITQTGSSLDELTGLIDRCPLDGSSTCSITSSSEFTAHRGVYDLTDKKTILHGHPRFSVIMSLLCDREECPNRGMCHIKCSASRHIEDVPIVPGEIGTGPAGLARTMPAAMKGRGVIVHGHGLFTAGDQDFTDAFRHLIDIERMCYEKYTGLTA